MATRAFYNEIDPHAAAWLRNLCALGEIPEGVVDERSIVDLRADDLWDFDECHFFAGVGVWARAVRDAENALGHRLERPLFTGSCPCQPLSAAGQRKGHVDERHLWPAFHHLIAQRGPATVVGEQVASKDGREWMSAVRADLEASGYAIGTAILPACGVGAPHLRYRLFWVAQSSGAEWGAGRPGWTGEAGGRPYAEPSGPSDAGLVADAQGWGSAARGGRGGRSRDSAQAGGQLVGHGPQGRLSGRADEERGAFDRPAGRDGAIGGLADAADNGREGRAHPERGRQAGERERPLWGEPVGLGEVGGLADADGGDASAEGLQRGGQQRQFAQDGRAGLLADADRERRQQVSRGPSGDEEADGRARRDGGEPDGDNLAASDGEDSRPRPPDSFWGAADWLYCRDGKWRPVEPGTFPLVDGSAFKLGSGGPFEGMSRAGMLRGYSNAVVLPVATAFVEAVMETMG